MINDSIVNKNLFEEINQLENIFLVSLNDTKICDLHIQICAGISKPLINDDNIFIFDGINNNKLKDLINKNAIIVRDTSKMYDIYFNGYLSYISRYEAFSKMCQCKPEKDGKFFKIYRKSKFLDYLKETTDIIFDEKYHKQYRHYQLICKWQIIDVVSEREPLIIKHEHERCEYI